MKKVSFGDGMSGLFIVTVMAFLFFRTFKVFALIGDVNVQFLSLSVIAFAGVILSRPRMRLMKWDVGLLAYIVMVILDGCLRTEHTVLAFEYWSVLVAFFAYKVVIQSDFVSMKRNVDWLYRCALIAVAAILLQVIAPAVVQMIQQVLMSPSAYSTALRSKERGYNTGLASQAAPAVWYCAPLLAFGIAKRFNAQTKKLTPLLLCGAAVIAMLFTQKRTVLLASLMAAYCLYFFFSRRKI